MLCESLPSFDSRPIITTGRYEMFPPPSANSVGVGRRAMYYACAMSTMSPTCQWCGVELPPHEGRGRKRKFCSSSCKQRAYEQRASVSGTSIPAQAVILAPERADDLRDQLFQLRCAAEDIATAHREGADQREIAELCEELVSMAKRVERLR